MALHSIVVMITVKFVLISELDKSRKDEIIMYQTALGMYCHLSTFDLYGVLSGLRLLKDVGEVEQLVRTVKYVRLQSANVVKKTEEVSRLMIFSSEHETCKNQESQPVQTYFKIDCKICRLEYSDVLTPRILNGCGHTICEKCTKILLKKNEGKFLSCPFCQKWTVVNGPASLLQKNYGILEIINDLKN